MPAQIPAVLARVNGEAIEKWEFDNAVKSVEQRAGGPVPAERRDEILRGVLDQLVTLHLLAQESKGRHIEVSDADIDGQIARIKQNYPNEEAFNKDVAAQGMTMLETLRAGLRVPTEVVASDVAQLNGQAAERSTSA